MQCKFYEFTRKSLIKKDYELTKKDQSKNIYIFDKTFPKSSKYISEFFFTYIFTAVIYNKLFLIKTTFSQKVQMPRVTLTELLDAKSDDANSPNPKNLRKYNYKTPEMQQKSIETLVKGRTTVIERKNNRKEIDKNIADEMNLKKVPVDGVNLDFDLKKLEAYEAANVLTARNKKQLAAMRSRFELLEKVQSKEAVNRKSVEFTNLQDQSKPATNSTNSQEDPQLVHSANSQDESFDKTFPKSFQEITSHLSKMTNHIAELQTELKGHTAKYEKSYLETQEYRQRVAKEKEERRQQKAELLEKVQSKAAAAAAAKKEEEDLQQEQPKKYVSRNVMRYNTTPLFSF